MDARDDAGVALSRFQVAALVAPALLVALGLCAALAAILQYSLRSYIPGSLSVGGFSLDNFTDLLKPLYARAALNTVLICFETATASLFLAYPLAYVLVRTRSVALKSAVLIITVTPLFLGEVVRTYSWVVVLGNSGFVNTLLLNIGLIDRPIPLLFTTLGVVIALVHVSLPIVVLMLAASLAHVDVSLEKAATSLGAGRIRTFLDVTLPLSTPGLVAGFTTAFAWTFSAFATPQIIGGGKVTVLSTLIYQLGFSSFNFPFAASLSVAGLLIALALTSALHFLTRRLTRRFGF